MSTDKIFTANPKLQKYFKTSDGTSFFREHDAAAHARSLKDKDVETVKRSAGFTKEDFEQIKQEAVEKIKAKALKPAKKKNSAKTSEGNPSGSDDSKKLTPMQAAKLRAEEISTLETVEAVEKALKDETAKSVINAGKARIEAINASNKEVTNQENK